MGVDPVVFGPMVLAGLSVGLWTSSPAEQVKRAGQTAPDSASPVGVVSRWPGGRSRPDAAPFRRRLATGLVAGTAVGVTGQAVGGESGWLAWVAAPVVTVVLVVVLGRLEPAAVKRRRRRLVLDLPQALELLSAGLAAGMPLRQATTAVAESFDGPVAEDLGRVLALVNLGVADAEAWRVLRDQPLWTAAAVDLARSVESGTMMVDVLAHHANDARTRRRADLEVRARAVGVRSVLPLMCCFLPAFMLLGVIPTVASAVMNAIF
ncbi:MAG: type II secretion system F family protein [Propionibacteriaceae bacterium]